LIAVNRRNIKRLMPEALLIDFLPGEQMVESSAIVLHHKIVPLDGMIWCAVNDAHINL
jgi:hypothetical protein